MGQISFVTNMIMAALFCIAIVGFAINFGYDNNSSVNIAQDPDMPQLKSDIQTKVELFYYDANTSSDAMQKSTISTQTESTEGGTSFKVTPANALGTAGKLVTMGYKKIFGSDSGFGIFLTALIAILGFMSALYIWKAWKAGGVD